MHFSGFQYKQLKINIIPHSNKLLSYLDVLVDGIYNENLKDKKRNWVGSTNQKFYYLTDKYNSQIETNIKYKNKVKFSINNSLQKWNRTKLRNWSEIYPQLCIFFSEIMAKYER